MLNCSSLYRGVVLVKWTLIVETCYMNILQSSALFVQYVCSASLDVSSTLGCYPRTGAGAQHSLLATSIHLLLQRHSTRSNKLPVTPSDHPGAGTTSKRHRYRYLTALRDGTGIPRPLRSDPLPGPAQHCASQRFGLLFLYSRCEGRVARAKQPVPPCAS